MEITADEIERRKWIAKKLLASRAPKNLSEWWGSIATYADSEETEQKRIANEFLLACLVDLRRRDDAWDAVRKFFERSPEFREDLWRKIHETSKEAWCSEAVFRLHWERPLHNRLWAIAAEIVYWFDGDARFIWSDGNAFNTLCRLNWIEAGPQISRMIVGALKDCKIVSGKSDPKADVRVCRVIGRSVLGKEIDPVNASAAIQICREIYPDDPWELDDPLYLLGERICKDRTPDCQNCYLREKCARFGKNCMV